MSRKPRGNHTKTKALGIPRVLQLIPLEKLTAILPVKVTPSVAEYVKQHGGSTWIRDAILMRLRKEAN